MSLHRGSVPQAWLLRPVTTPVSLKDWLEHMQGTHRMLQHWITSGGHGLDKIRMGYISNVRGLVVAFQEDVVRAKGWPAEEAFVEIEPFDAEGRPRSRAATDTHFEIEGVGLVGAEFDEASGLLHLTEKSDAIQG